MSGEPTVQPLNAAMAPAQGKEWGCRGCKLFQYAPCFKKSDREVYQASLDPLRKEKKNFSYKLGSYGSEESDILVVFDGPTKAETQRAESFSGGEARIVRRNAQAVGLDSQQWHWVYLNRCTSPDGKFAPQKSIYCSRFLAETINRLKPKVIIAFGPTVLISLLGKSDAKIDHFVCKPQHATISGHNCVVYPMMSPGWILYNDYMSGRYLKHFERMAAYLRGDTDVDVDESVKSVITDPDRAIEVCKHLIEAVERDVSIDADLETSGLNPYKKGSRISVISLGKSCKRGYALMYNHNDCPWSDADRKRVLKEGIRPLLRHPKVKLRWHNGKFDVKWVRHHLKFWPRDQIEDTMLTHYASDENVEHGLKPLALMFTDMGDYDAELDEYLRSQDLPDAPRYDLVPHKLLGKYAAMDVVATRKLSKALKPLVDEQGPFVQALAYRALPAFSATLSRVEHNGAHIDRAYAVEKLIPYLEAESSKGYNDIISQPIVRKFERDGEAAKRAKMKRPKPIEVKQYFKFNLNSSQQLNPLLYDAAYFGHEITVFTDKGAPSTDKEALNDLAALGSPIAKAIVDYRLDTKMCESFGKPLVARIDEQDDGLLHGDLVIHGTKCVTGDVLVLTENGEVAIADLLSGAPEGFSAPPSVRVWDGVSWRLPVASFVATDAEVLQVTVDDGSYITGTPEHPLLSPVGWVRIKEIRPGTQLLKYSASGAVYCCTVREVRYAGRRTVYDLTMEDARVQEAYEVRHAVPFVLAYNGEHGDSLCVDAPGSDAGRFLRPLPGRSMDACEHRGEGRRSHARHAEGSGDAREDARCRIESADRTEEVGLREKRCSAERSADERHVLEESGERGSRQGAPEGYVSSSTQGGSELSEESTGRSEGVVGGASRGGEGPGSEDCSAPERHVLEGAGERSACEGARPCDEPRGSDAGGPCDQSVRGGRVGRDAPVCGVHRGREVVAPSPVGEVDQSGLSHPGNESSHRGVRGAVAPAVGREEADRGVGQRGIPLPRDMESAVEGEPREGDSATAPLPRICHAFVTNGFVSHNTGRLSGRNPNCFTGDTEVLTAAGWVRFDAYDGAPLAQWDAGKVTLVKPTAIQRVDGMHHMVQITGDGVDLNVTEDHRCLIAREDGACKVFRAHEYPETGGYQINSGNYDALGVPWSSAQIRMLAGVHAAGEYQPDGSILLSRVDSYVVTDFADACRACKIPAIITPLDNDKGASFVIPPKSAEWFRSVLGEKNEIGAWVMKMRQGQLLTFLHATQDWGVHHYPCRDKESAGWVQTIAALTDHAASVVHDTRVKVSRDPWTPARVTKRAYDYKGVVYCATVPSSYLLVRRNGVIHATGNCQQIPNKGNGSIKRMFDSRYGDDGVFIQIDFSQIELRILAALSGDPTMIEVYKNNGDIHTMNACAIFGMTVEEMHKLSKEEQKRRRTVAKRVGFGLCLCGDTEVLTLRGKVRIRDVRNDDQLWDGNSWVSHSGVVRTGVRKVIRVGDVWCTPEHEILTDEGWVPAWRVLLDNMSLSAACSESGQLWLSGCPNEELSSPLPCAAGDAEGTSSVPGPLSASPSLEDLSAVTAAREATCGRSGVAETPPVVEGCPPIRGSCPTLSSAISGSHATITSNAGAVTRPAGVTSTTARGESDSTSLCETASTSCGTPSRFLGGTTQLATSTASTTPEGIDRGTCGWSPGLRTPGTPAATSSSNTTGSACAPPTSGNASARAIAAWTTSSTRSKPECQPPESFWSNPSVEVRTVDVYDVVDAGPHHCFQAGSLIVHNCYGIGGPGIQSTLKSDGVIVTEDEARSYIDVFFDKFPRVARFIEKAENATEEDAFSLSCFGRRRRLEMVRSNKHDFVARALRQGVNHRIQSTAGDMTMTALCLFDQEVCLRSGINPSLVHPTIDHRKFEVDERWNRVHTILQVHDMIGLDAHKDVAGAAVDSLLDTMQNVVDYSPFVWGDVVIPTLKPLKRVPILAEAEVGPNWRDAYKVKSGADVEKAMHVARVRRSKTDVDLMYKWGENDEKEALASWEKAA